MFDIELAGGKAACHKAGRDLLICFSHLRWDFVFQRPQHLLTRAAKEFQVVFFEEPAFELHADPHLRRRSTWCGVEVVTPVFPSGLDGDAVTNHQRAMLEQILLPAQGQAIVFWYYTPMALEFSASFPPDLCIYDCMDELSLFKGAPKRLLEFESLLFSRADLVFTGGMSLYTAKCSRHPRIFVFPSSVDRGHFARARNSSSEDPADQQDTIRPRLGFFGVIDERMDFDLVDAIASMRSDWSLIMLGPVVKVDPATLPRRANIHWLGCKSYDELPLYLAHWDAAIMPFARNDATRFISPTKTPEFLAAGRRVISTPITDVVNPYGADGLVAIADTPDAFVAEVERAITARDALWLARVDRRLAAMSWDRTWAQMRAKMRLFVGGDIKEAANL